MSLRMEPSSTRVPPPPMKPPSRSNSSNNLARAPSTVPIAPSQGPSRIPLVLSRAQTEIKLNTQPAVPTGRYQGVNQQAQDGVNQTQHALQQQQQPASAQQLRSACSEPEQQQQFLPSQTSPWYQQQQQQQQQQQSQQPQPQSSIAFVGSTTYSSNEASPAVSVHAQRPVQQAGSFLQQNETAAAPPPPLPDIAVQRLQQSSGGIDRESLRPSGYRSTTPVRNVGSTGSNTNSGATATFSKNQYPFNSAYSGTVPPSTGGVGGGSGFSRAAAAFASPSREDFRRATSPGMSWASSAAPRFRYEPPPMIPTYFDVERLALTPVKERRKESDERRLPVKERWGPPVRTIPNRFNSIPASGQHYEFEEENEDDGYARRIPRDESRSSRRGLERQSRHHHGDRFDEPRSERRRHHRRHPEDIVVTPREDDKSRRHHRDVYADASVRYETPTDKYERREERSERRARRHEQFAADVGDRSGRHRSHRDVDPSSPREDEHRRSRRHYDDRYEMDDGHRRVRSDEDGHARAHPRSSARHQPMDDPQSPDSYVVGSSKAGALASGRDVQVDVEHGRHAASPSASSRRRNDETEEQYRIRRRTEREHRRMLAR